MLKKSGSRTVRLAPIANKVDGKWEVAYFVDGNEVALVIVDPRAGRCGVLDRVPGGLEDGSGLRGCLRAQARRALRLPAALRDLPLGLVDWRRFWRVANLDLLVLLGFGVSHFFFNRAEIGVSVPLQYPVLLYLLGRAL